MKRIILSNILFVFAFVSLSAAKGESSSDRLRGLFVRLYAERDSLVQTQINDSIKNELLFALKTYSEFAITFDSVPGLGRVVSDDEKIVIYSWNYAFNYDENKFPRQYAYNSVIQTDDGLVQYMFQDKPYKPKENAKFSSSRWYGSLYYRIIPYRYDGEDVYICMGWCRHSTVAQFKVIEVIRVEMGVVLFGQPIFKANNLVKTRLVYEYDGALQMGIEYDENKNRFLIDHLVPLRTLWNGQTLLGPDESVDAYIKRGSYWVLKENIRAFNRYNNENTRRIKPPVPRVLFRP